MSTASDSLDLLLNTHPVLQLCNLINIVHQRTHTMYLWKGKSNFAFSLASKELCVMEPNRAGAHEKPLPTAGLILIHDQI